MLILNLDQKNGWSVVIYNKWQITHFVINALNVFLWNFLRDLSLFQCIPILFIYFFEQRRFTSIRLVQTFLWFCLHLLNKFVLVLQSSYHMWKKEICRTEIASNPTNHHEIRSKLTKPSSRFLYFSLTEEVQLIFVGFHIHQPLENFLI